MRRAWDHVAAAIAVVCLLAAPVLADVTVLGDRSAYDELVASYTKLFSLPGFRAKVANPKGQHFVLEFSAPNNWHMGTPDGPYEVIHAGGRVATRLSVPGQPSGWRCQPARQDRPLWDPTKATGTYTLSRGPDTAIDGTPVHTIYWNKGDKRNTTYVGSQNGLPKRVIGEDGQIVDYYDYGANVVIPPPPCPP